MLQWSFLLVSAWVHRVHDRVSNACIHANPKISSFSLSVIRSHSWPLSSQMKDILAMVGKAAAPS
jgi:hypothetical protein